MTPLPCPFCGSEAEWVYRDWNEVTETGDDGSGQVECSGCAASVFRLDREDAETAWNTRRVFPKLISGTYKPVVLTDTQQIELHNRLGGTPERPTYNESKVKV